MMRSAAEARRRNTASLKSVTITSAHFGTGGAPVATSMSEHPDNSAASPALTTGSAWQTLTFKRRTGVNRCPFDQASWMSLTSIDTTSGSG